MSPQPVIAIAAALAGACVGSFTATATLRAIRAEQSIVGRSRCDSCATSLGFGVTVPVLSFVRLRGACAHCGGRIDPAHLIGETAGLAIGAAAVLSAPSLARAALLAALGFVLLAASIHDGKTRRLPDVLTLVSALLAAGLAVTKSGQALEIGVGCALVTFLVLEGLRRGFLALKRKPGLGFGDVKLAAALAIWLGLATPWAIAAAAIGGLVFFLAARPKDGRIAFGPFLALGAWLVGVVLEAVGWPMF